METDLRVEYLALLTWSVQRLLLMLLTGVKACFKNATGSGKVLAINRHRLETTKTPHLTLQSETVKLSTVQVIPHKTETLWGVVAATPHRKLSHITYSKDGENFFIYQRNSRWVIIFFVLMTSLSEEALIAQREI